MECRSLRDSRTSTDLNMSGGLRNRGDTEEKREVFREIRLNRVKKGALAGLSD